MLGEKFLELYKSTELIIPSSVPDTDCSLIEPEDLNEPIDSADVTVHEKNVSLKLSSTHDMDSLPRVTVLITDVSQPILLENSINNTTYPYHLLAFVTVNCKYRDYKSIDVQSINIESLMAQVSGICVVMSSLYWYYPHSIYAKVKLLLDNDHKLIVGTNTIPHYMLAETPSSVIRETDIPPLETCAIRSSSRVIQRSQYMTMPFSFNCISISQHKPVETCTPTNNIFSLIDFSTQCIVNKLYRSVYGRSK